MIICSACDWDFQTMEQLEDTLQIGRESYEEHGTSQNNAFEF